MNDTAQIVSHDCFYSMTEIWHNNFESNWITCGTCGRITHFTWKNKWLGLKMLLWKGTGSFRNLKH